MSRFQRALLVIVGLALAGCGETKPSQFYVLSSLPLPANPVRSNTAGAVSVSTIELPKYVDRTNIVAYSSQNSVTLAEYDRWAEPLPDGFKRVLVENLSVLLPDRRVEALPFASGNRDSADRRVTANVTRFHAAPDGTVELRATWHILSADGRQSLASGTTAVSEARDGDSYAATAAAMSRAIAALSREIADAIRGTGRRTGATG